MSFREKLAIQILFVIARLLAPQAWRSDVGGLAAEFHIAARKEAL